MPVRPKPEPTGAGGFRRRRRLGAEAHVEPFAIAALVWAVVSIVIPVIGTIVAFVLANAGGKPASAVKVGSARGTPYVAAARIVAGAVLAL